MVIKKIFVPSNTCFCQNNVEILPIFISLHFVDAQSMAQSFSGRMRVPDAHYKTVFKVPFQEALEKSYGQSKMLKVKVCKCPVASIVNGFQKYFTLRFGTLGPFKKYP